MIRPHSIPDRRKAVALGLFVLSLAVGIQAREFETRRLSAPGADARHPAIGSTGLVAWQGHVAHADDSPLSRRTDVLRAPPGATRSDVFVWRDGNIRNITIEDPRIIGRSLRPRVYGDAVIFTAWFRDDAEPGYPFDLTIPPKTEEMLRLESEYPTLFDPPTPATRTAVEAVLASGDDGTPPDDRLDPVARDEPNASLQHQMWRGSGPGGDIVVYRADSGIQRITPGTRHFSNPVMSEHGIAFQVARGWPYGYEILFWKPGNNQLTQITTNYFYVLNPDIHEYDLVFQGWDGVDYEIFHYRFDTGELRQVTNNQFDDTHPVVWNGEIAWIAHPTVNPEIFHMREGRIRRLSEDSQDNSAPSIWQGRVVWQGYDDTDLEIYYFDGRRTIKLTSNTWDDIAPQIRDGLITWMSYVGNSAAQIMALDLSNNITVQLTETDWEDAHPRTANERIVWQSLTPDGAAVMIAEPKEPRTADIN